MSNVHQRNNDFLNSLSDKDRQAILKNIANHYGISLLEALIEVTDKFAEDLPEYVTGPLREEVYRYYSRSSVV